MGAFLRSYTPVMPFQGGGGGFLSITLKKNFTIYCILFQGQGNWFLVSRFSDPAYQDIAAPDGYTGKAHGRPEIQHLVFRRKTGEENWEMPSGWHSRGQSTAQFHFTGELFPSFLKLGTFNLSFKYDKPVEPVLCPHSIFKHI